MSETQPLKRQRWKHGLLYCITLNNGSAVRGKILNDISNVVFDQVFHSPTALKEGWKTSSRNPLLYGDLAHFEIKQSFFEVVSHESVTPEELSVIPPDFRMLTAHPENCIILYPGTGESRKALPSECKGLNYAFSWEGPGYVQLIEDKLKG